MDWLFFMESSLAGLATGAIYALVALGFVIIYKATKVINFAIGEIMMISAYFFLTFAGILEWPIWAALPAAVACGGLLGSVIV
jgi:branched-chain amino acid transport system permease protein